MNLTEDSATKHRGFAFVTFSSQEDAQDAIDNMDLNELQGRVLKVSLARPMKTPAQLGGNRAGMYLNASLVHTCTNAHVSSLGIRGMVETVLKAIS
jgi:RNA recognition motif-containing protein